MPGKPGGQDDLRDSISRSYVTDFNRSQNTVQQLGLGRHLNTKNIAAPSQAGHVAVPQTRRTIAYSNRLEQPVAILQTAVVDNDLGHPAGFGGCR